MRRRILIALLILLTFATTAGAQTAPTVIQKSIAVGTTNASTPNNVVYTSAGGAGNFTLSAITANHGMIVQIGSTSTGSTAVTGISDNLGCSPWQSNVATAVAEILRA